MFTIKAEVAPGEVEATQYQSEAEAVRAWYEIIDRAWGATLRAPSGEALRNFHIMDLED
ncbi:hypothetical protein [Maricaulis sp.]|uniref:hypothetical protein n=1 Tax=Maricaulis sp. TaxID=1486257 RepID=UPI00261260CD|nr:hypothetical protein [Maricaulis sp.]MDF1769847.1 hypothetical protein [Maricaulis sp.]